VSVLAGTIDVVEGAAEVHGRFTIGPTKTGTRRSVPIPRAVAAMIGEHVGRYPSDDAFVFTAGEGGPIRHGTARRGESRGGLRGGGSRSSDGLQTADGRNRAPSTALADAPK